MEPKELREQLGLTQEEMARRLGVSVSCVCRWEQGNRRPSRLTRRLIDRLERKTLKALGVKCK